MAAERACHRIQHVQGTRLCHHEPHNPGSRVRPCFEKDRRGLPVDRCRMGRSRRRNRAAPPPPPLDVTCCMDVTSCRMWSRAATMLGQVWTRKCTVHGARGFGHCLGRPCMADVCMHVFASMHPHSYSLLRLLFLQLQLRYKTCRHGMQKMVPSFLAIHECRVKKAKTICHDEKLPLNFPPHVMPAWHATWFSFQTRSHSLQTATSPTFSCDAQSSLQRRQTIDG